MEIKEIIAFINNCIDKNILKELSKAIETKINASINIGDTVTFTIYYMIGDADGDTEYDITFDKITQTELDALAVITHILDTYTEPNSGTWGFMLNQSDFSEKDSICKVLFNNEDDEEDEEDENYTGVKVDFIGVKVDTLMGGEIVLTEAIIDEIQYIVEETFRSDTDYSFLVYQYYTIEQ